MEIGATIFAVGAIAVWRIAHLLHAEDGPWDVMASLRKRTGNAVFGKMLDCFYCVSVWAAIPVAATVGATWKERILLWPALSGAAILLERSTTRWQPQTAQQLWYEEPERQSVRGEGK